MYPVTLQLKLIECLVVGGGSVAERKANSLLQAEANVTVLSPQINEGLTDLFAAKKIHWQKRLFEQSDTQKYFLIIAATNDREVNRHIALEAKQNQRLVNVVDDPELSNFFVPAVVRRGALSIAVSTGGASPAVAKRIRRQLEEEFDESYVSYLELMENLRKRVLSEYADESTRRNIFNRLADADLLTLIRAGEHQGVKEMISKCLSSS